MTGGFEPGGIAGAGLGGSVAGVVGTGEDVAPVAVAEEAESAAVARADTVTVTGADVVRAASESIATAVRTCVPSVAPAHVAW